MPGGKKEDPAAAESSGEESKQGTKRTSSPDGDSKDDGDTDSQDVNRRSRRKKPRVRDYLVIFYKSSNNMFIYVGPL